ncbi:MAG: hypothetical protein ACI37S_02355 [Candidatus Gastranaerophilaceae bacterium]
MHRHHFKYSLIALMFIFISPAIAASDSNNNELLKMDVSQTSENSVKVNIYTDKPYNEQIIVNKKPDNKYVILLPETTNAMVAQPDISEASSVKNIDVKTQQYSSLPGKGYTKITIDSKKPIEVIPQAHVTHQMPKSNLTTTAKKSSLTEQVQTALPQRVLNQRRPATFDDFSSSSERQTPTQQSSNSRFQIQRSQANSGYNNYSQSRIAQNTQPESQPSRNILNSFTQQTAATETTNNSALTQNEQVALEDNNKAIDDEVTTQSKTDDDELSEADLAFFKKIVKIKQKIINKIKQILSIRISFVSFMTVLQFILLIVLVKIIKDLVQKIQETTEQQPVTRRLIHDNNETFEQSYPSYSNMDVYNSARSNFEEDNKEGFNVQSLAQSMGYRQNRPLNRYGTRQNNISLQGGYSNSNDFYRPLNEINEEERMSIFDENAKDIEKTIFKNPLTQISKQAEEQLFDEVEIAEENSPFPTENPYEINEKEEFFNYNYNSQNDDENFFIFEDNDENSQEEYDDDFENEEEYQDEEYEYSDDDTDVEYEEDYEEEPSETESQPIVEQKPKEPINPFEHLTVKSKYVIDSNRGFAQVNVDGINALIGYVGSKISVIRKFNEEVKTNMQVRLNEQPDPETMIYIIKVGSYKTLVEVKQNSIRQLLDL